MPSRSLCLPPLHELLYPASIAGLRMSGQHVHGDRFLHRETDGRRDLLFERDHLLHSNYFRHRDERVGRECEHESPLGRERHDSHHHLHHGSRRLLGGCYSP